MTLRAQIEATIELVVCAPKSFSTCSWREPGYALAQYCIGPGGVTPGCCSQSGSVQLSW